MSSTDGRKSARIPFLDTVRGFAILAVFLYHAMGPAYKLHKFPFDLEKHYAALGISASATVDEISMAFRTLQAANSDADRLEEIEIAYQVLSDPGQRAQYDRSLQWRDIRQAPLAYWLVLPCSFGAAGVAIFFVVSGFCIHVSHVKSQETDFYGFSIRRVLRIIPPYFAALLIFGFIYPWRKVLISPDGWIQFWSHLGLVHNLHGDTYFGINPSFWSIAVEFQLYLIYPLLFLISRKWSWNIAIIVAMLIELSIRAYLVGHDLVSLESLPRWLTANPFAYWLSWSLGAWLGEKFLNDEPMPLLSQSVWGWALLAMACEFYRPATHLTFTMYSMATAVLLAKVLAGRVEFPEFSFSKLLSKHLGFVGMISYSLYLIHQPIIEMMPEVFQKAHLDHLHPILKFAVCLCLWVPVLLLSWLMYKWLEVPSIRLAKRLVKKKPA